MRRLFCLWLLLFAASSFAFAPSYQSWNTNGDYIKTTAAASCTAFAYATWASNGSGVLSGAASPYTCTPYAGTAAGPTGQTTGGGALACPANSTNTAGDCSCTAGYIETNGSCSPQVSACQAKLGTVKTVNRTVGFTRSTADSDLSFVGTIVQTPPGTALCQNGCIVETSSTGTAAWTSMVPTAQGLYRKSLDLVATYNGTACSSSNTSDPPNNPKTPDPVCPGYVGEVNGKIGCFGTASKPVVTAEGPRPEAFPAPGNPAAGEKPDTGAGSGIGGAGRTPSTGAGGNAGGPASAAVGPSGTASAPSAGLEQLNCGAPGQAPCRIDESGTGDGKTAYDAAKTALDTNSASSKTAIDGAASITAPSWSFTFQFPTGCTPYNTGIKGFVMNPCTVQPVIHDLMSMIWAAVTAFAIIGMVGRTIRES